MLRIAFSFAIFVPLVAGCSSSSPTTDNDPYPTFEACFNDHHNVESFPTGQAIEICCLDHPIGNQPMDVVCGATVQDCTTYVTANLMPADATSTDIMAACADYVTKHGK